MTTSVSNLYKGSASKFGYDFATRVLLAKVLRKFRNSSRWADREFSSRNFSHPVHMRVGSSDWYALHKIFVEGEYKEKSEFHRRALHDFYEKIIEKGLTPLIVDCGANVGFSAIWFARLFPKAKIIAIEPERKNFDVLQKNTKTYGNVEAIHAAVSNIEKRLYLENDTENADAWRTVEVGDGDYIESVTIDGLIGAREHVVPFIAKIDIEGHERELFSGDADWSDLFPLIIVETHDWLYPGNGSAHAVYSSLSKKFQRDYLISGENMFIYRLKQPDDAI